MAWFDGIVRLFRGKASVVAHGAEAVAHEALAIGNVVQKCERMAATELQAGTEAALSLRHHTELPTPKNARTIAKKPAPLNDPPSLLQLDKLEDVEGITPLSVVVRTDLDIPRGGGGVDRMVHTPPLPERGPFVELNKSPVAGYTPPTDPHLPSHANIGSVDSTFTQGFHHDPIPLSLAEQHPTAPTRISDSAFEGGIGMGYSQNDRGDWEKLVTGRKTASSKTKQVP